MSETIIKPTDLALTADGDTVLVVDIKSAKDVYSGFYDTDDKGGHIWLGGDNVIPYTDVLAQVCSGRGLEWILLSDLSQIDV